MEEPIHQVIAEIPANGLFYQSIEHIFPQAGEITGGYLEGRVRQGGGVGAFALIELQDPETVIGLQAIGSLGSDPTYSAQLASVPGLFTSINLINGGFTTQEATLKPLGTDGTPLSAPVTRTLRPGEQLTEDAAELFNLPAPASSRAPAGATPFIGSLVVSGAPGVVGDVMFGDSDNLDFAADLLLQGETFLDAVFNQVANVAGFLPVWPSSCRVRKRPKSRLRFGQPTGNWWAAQWKIWAAAGGPPARWRKSSPTRRARLAASCGCAPLVPWWPNCCFWGWIRKGAPDSIPPCPPR